MFYMHSLCKFCQVSRNAVCHYSRQYIAINRPQNTHLRHCGVTGTVMAGGLLRDLDLLLVVLPLEDLVGFFLLLGTSLAPDTFSDLFRLFEALVTLLNLKLYSFYCIQSSVSLTIHPSGKHTKTRLIYQALLL